MGKSIILIIALTFNIFAQHVPEKKTPLNLEKVNLQNSNIDSLLSISRTHHSEINVGGQVIVGGAMGLASAFIPFGVAFVASFSETADKSVEDFWTAVAISAYAFGTATGVHIVAKAENKNHSFWKTVMYSEFGALVASGAVIVVKSINNNNTFANHQGGVLILIMPVACSLIYSLAYADWPQQNLSTANCRNFEISNKALSLKDLVDQSQIIKINLFRISL